jgi:hypothetical protein
VAVPLLATGGVSGGRSVMLTVATLLSPVPSFA